VEDLRSEALSSEDTVDDNERMFIAALLDARNVAALKRTPFQQLPDSIEFPVASITPAARANGRPTSRSAASSRATRAADRQRSRDRDQRRGQ
jgi:hypothetical protein